MPNPTPNARAHQSLSAGVLWRLAGLFLLAGAGLLWAANSVVQQRFDAFDASQYDDDVKRAATVIASDNQSLLAALQDYAKWDDAFAYMAQPNDAFIAASFASETLTNLRIDADGMLALGGKMQYSIQLMAPGQFGTATPDLQAALAEQLRLPLAASGRLHVGQIDGRPAVLALFPITPTKADKPANGTMFFMRYLDGAYQARTEALTGAHFTLSTGAPSKDAMQHAAQKQHWLASTSVAGSTVFVSTSGPTQLESERQYVFWILAATALAFSVLSLVGVNHILRVQVLGRLVLFSNLADQARSTPLTGSDPVAWPVQGQDELDNLAVSLNDMWAQSKAHQTEMALIAFFDTLTSLPNRRLMQDRLQRTIANNERKRSHAALILVDLDHFKSLNDSLGHEEGDACLIEVGVRLQAAIRNVDTAARLGGDEFTVMLEGLSSDATQAALQAERVTQKIYDSLTKPFFLPQGIYTCTASLGVTIFNGHGATMADLFKQADLAMYKAKREGRNGWRFFDPTLQQVAHDRQALEQDLAHALQDRQFHLAFQVQQDAQAHATGAEVLLRWTHPVRGAVSPALFIPAAESTGLIVPLGNWVLQTACAQLALWATQPAFAHLTMSVNVSAYQFQKDDFVQQVLAALDQSGASGAKLKLELTESMLVADIDSVIGKMSALKLRGVTFSLDDFGTGYSSLAYLKRLPLDQLKIDQSFVRDVLTDSNDVAIVKTILSLAQAMGLSVIAEGVETQAVHQALVGHGCPGYQGYLLGRPVPVAEFESALVAATLSRGA